jgi:malate synthase
MKQIIDIRYARMIDELQQLLEDVIGEDQVSTSTETLTTYVDRLPKELRSRANRLLRKRQDAQTGNFKNDHYVLMTTLYSWNQKFSFKAVLDRYRSGINPIRALYYEARHVAGNYDHSDPYHQWLLDTVLESQFHRQIVTALKKDIKRLEEFVAKYYHSFESTSVPIELFHVMYTLEDYIEYLKFFQKLAKSPPTDY